MDSRRAKWSASNGESMSAHPHFREPSFRSVRTNQNAALPSQAALTDEDEGSFEKQKTDIKDVEIVTLQTELEKLKKEVGRKVGHLQQAEFETTSFSIMSQRMILTKEAKRWRKWFLRDAGLLVIGGWLWNMESVQIYQCPSMNSGQHLLLYRLKLLSLPDKRLKMISWVVTAQLNTRQPVIPIEDAVMLAMAQHRRPNLIRDLKSPVDLKFIEAFELNNEESDDVLFKQGWLIYFWNRARNHSVEVDIAEEQPQNWISRSSQSPTSHDAVDVERGLIELKKMGIEQQLWEASRKEIQHLPFSLNGNDHKQSSDPTLASNVNQEQSSESRRNLLIYL